MELNKWKVDSQTVSVRETTQTQRWKSISRRTIACLQTGQRPRSAEYSSIYLQFEQRSITWKAKLWLRGAAWAETKRKENIPSHLTK